ncbi:hypothetical protein RI367_001062 [Sorochytrium milnesiophthora]
MTYSPARRNAVCYSEGDAELVRIRAMVAANVSPCYDSDDDSSHHDSDACFDSDSDLPATTTAAAALCRTTLPATLTLSLPIVLA